MILKMDSLDSNTLLNMTMEDLEKQSIGSSANPCVMICD